MEESSDNIVFFQNANQIISYINQNTTHNTHTGFYLLLEGKSDTSFFKDIRDKSICILIVANGWKAIKETFERSNEIPEIVRDKIIGIMDTDFDHFIGVRYTHDHVCYTDTRDLETMLLSSLAFEKFIKSHIDKNAFLMSTYREPTLKYFQEIIIKKIQYIGLVRLINEKYNHQLYIKNLHEEIITKTSDVPTLEQVLIEACKSKSNNTDFVKKLKQEAEKNYDSLKEPWFLCRGHDLIHALIVSLSDSNWMKSKIAIKENPIREDMIRYYHSMDLFKKTSLYQSICKIMGDIGYKVFIKPEYDKEEWPKRRNSGYNRFY